MNKFPENQEPGFYCGKNVFNRLLQMIKEGETASELNEQSTGHFQYREFIFVLSEFLAPDELVGVGERYEHVVHVFKNLYGER